MISKDFSLLVVDDNEMNRDVLSRRLKRQGYEVSMAEDGRQALDMIREKSFHLILLDIMMPGMNGYQVLESLKSDQSLREIPVIMTSALDEADRIEQCIEMGAEDYLQKPFDMILVKARISECLVRNYS